MSKDQRDTETIDMIGNKIGRPVLNPDTGPMSDQERQRRYRAGRKSVQVLLSDRDKEKFFRYCVKNEISHHQFLTDVIKSLRLKVPYYE